MRRCLASLITSVAVVPLLVVDAGAVTDDAPPPTAASRAATPATPVVDGRPGAGDEDGLRTRSQDIDLGDAPLAIDLPTEPEMVIFDEVEVGTEIAIRSRNDGEWSPWTHLHADDEHAPDGRPGDEGASTSSDAASAGIGPIWLGEGADRIEVKREDGDDRAIRLESLVVLDTPSVDADAPQGIRASATAAAGAPFIRPRSSWATSGMGWASYNGGCGEGPSADANVWAMVVHHTAGRNGYTAADVPAIIRGIWYYHVQSRGWCDVAYNFFVDRFGGVWEGRQGGVDKAIVGGHTFGHNTETTGVAQLGDFSATSAPSAMTAATAKLIGWKLGVHGLDPLGRSTLTNRASSTTPKGLAPGASVDVPSVLGHRDLGSTACPGSSTYARLGTIKDGARPGAHVVVLHRTFVGSVTSLGNHESWLAYAHANGLEGTARRMARSDAYAGKLVADLYRRALGRAPDPGGRQYWVSRIQAGAGLRDISIGFYASAERYQQSFDTPEVYVRGLYRDILHREPDAAGLQDWSQRIRQGEPRTRISGGFFNSVESRADRVDRLYQSILDRSADPNGIGTWSRYLLHNDDLDLAAYLTASAEYFQRNLR